MTQSFLGKFPRLSKEERDRLLTPPQGKIRLVIDTDAHNEIDDQFALTWALLSREVFDIEGIYAVPYSFSNHQKPMLQAYELMKMGREDELSGELVKYTGWVKNFLNARIDPYQLPFVSPQEGMELSYQEILRVCQKLNQDINGKVFRGSKEYLTAYDKPVHSPASEHLINRALASNQTPLYIAAIGCLPNIASAILIEPEIIKRIVVIWTSGYPSFFNLSNSPSFNLVQDVLASQLLFECGVPLVYLPGFNVGAQLSISLPEMEAWVKGKGAIGDYLFDLYLNNPIRAQRGITDHFGRSWVIWDLINFAWLLHADWVPSQLVPTPKLGDDLSWHRDPNRHLMREAFEVDRDAIFRDFFMKLDKASALQ